MLAEKTISITIERDGKPTTIDVRMRYCAAAEMGFESISGKSAEVFSPTVVKRDRDGKPIQTDKPTATTEDYVLLASAAIVAAYARTKEETPVTSNDIMYECEPSEVLKFITTVIELRNLWYTIPAVVQTEDTDEHEDDEDVGKNA